MALAGADRATIQAWSGTIDTEEEEAVEEAVGRLGTAIVVALERVCTRLADFEMNTADLSSANDRANHASNVGWLRDQRDRIIGAVESQVASGDLVLTTTAEDFVASLTQVGIYTRPMKVSWTAQRRA